MCQVRKIDESVREREGERKAKYLMGSHHWFYDSPRAQQQYRET